MIIIIIIHQRDNNDWCGACNLQIGDDWCQFAPKRHRQQRYPRLLCRTARRKPACTVMMVLMVIMTIYNISNIRMCLLICEKQFSNSIMANARGHKTSRIRIQSKWWAVEYIALNIRHIYHINNEWMYSYFWTYAHTRPYIHIQFRMLI